MDYSTTPSTNLALDLRADTGVTLDGSGRVSQWNDQHLTLNNDGSGPHNATNATTGNRPYFTYDSKNQAAILFPWGYSTDHPKTWITVPTSLTGLDTGAVSVYIVATGRGPRDTTGVLTAVTLGTFGTGWAKFYFDTMSCAQRISTFQLPMNKAVMGFIGRDNTTTDGVCQWNGTRTITTSPPGFTGYSGADIGRYGQGGSLASDGDEYFSGLIYRILIYKEAHTNSQIDAVVAALTAQHNVTPTYANRAVCVGDSITEGVTTTLYRNYPYQLTELLPEWEIFNLGVGGWKFTDLTSDATANVDPLFDTTKNRNILVVMCGTNDMSSDGISGATCFTRHTTYCAARKAAKPWTILVPTTVDRSSIPTQITDYNALIRLGSSSYDAISDCGRDSPYSDALDDASDMTMFTDGVHPTNAGAAVIAKYVALSLPFLFNDRTTKIRSGRTSTITPGRTSTARRR